MRYGDSSNKQVLGKQMMADLISVAAVKKSFISKAYIQDLQNPAGATYNCKQGVQAYAHIQQETISATDKGIRRLSRKIGCSLPMMMDPVAMVKNLQNISGTVPQDSGVS